RMDKRYIVRLLRYGAELACRSRKEVMFGHIHHSDCDSSWDRCEDPRLQIFRAMAGRMRGGRGPGHHGHGGPSGFGGGGFPPEPPHGRLPMGDVFWSFFGKAQRARRGDVRAAILALLAEKPFNGYQIIQELEQRSQGAWKPSPGSVYPTFQQLEDEGLVTTEASGSGRVYRSTPSGEQYVKEHEDEVREPWAVAARAAGMDSHQQVHEVLDELRRSGRQPPRLLVPEVPRRSRRRRNSSEIRAALSIASWRKTTRSPRCLASTSARLGGLR
ncbi:MAG: PadR family transcriptional regulator, partial [Polyangiaceae bacterium]